MHLASPAHRQTTSLSQPGIIKSESDILCRNINFRHSLPSSHNLTLELMEVFLVKQSMLSLLDLDTRSNRSALKTCVSEQ